MITNFYSLAGYGEMIADRVRVEAYSRALRAAIRPGSVVLDIGTGPGILAVLACRFGAGRVFAIEANPVIQLAREIAAANRCADKIEFIEDLSHKYQFANLGGSETASLDRYKQKYSDGGGRSNPVLAIDLSGARSFAR